MSDITVKTSQLNVLAETLGAIAVLSPPPEPKGRYILGRAVPVAVRAAQAHEAAIQPILDDFATADAEGKPIFTALPQGGRAFNIRPEKLEEWQAIQDEPVTLSGVRQITRAELGKCPITVQQEMVLVECGLLEDAEPA